MNSTKPIIETRDVHLYYGKNEALKGISLDFYKKEITALIGPSGCGKSTYLRTLNRMNDLIPDVTVTGKISFNGQDIYSPQMDTVELRKKVGMVFQQPNPFPFSVFDNVAYGLRIAGMKDKEKIARIVEESLKKAAVWDDVKDKLDQSALSLSGGQQQRVCIARVLAIEPEVILLDEPTSALDPISSAQIERMLMELKEDYTMIIVTHNMQQASRISDNTAFFLSGELIEFGETSQIFTNPKEKQTEDYISGRFG
ncbi:phosphate ABC transporter ATP-binding protein PstB [Trichococcus ilyis]|uniref:Abc transporter n=1 Tax=Trichococcus ilyis TaxID=640938 RepID=A0A143Y9C6_9LACT|nr:phosphate ABC transporter ATP-binding protein PstB [Trichococcus ilyis]CZQ84134.1 abc transporter [Trichococcus ilyis]SEJ31538.1 phosphate transport system ATP-binding protein [Trichococcus ilyis]